MQDRLCFVVNKLIANMRILCNIINIYKYIFAFGNIGNTKD